MCENIQKDVCENTCNECTEEMEKSSEDLVSLCEKQKAEAEAAQNEIKLLKDELARSRADYHNLRTRVERNKERDKKFAAEKSIEILLPVYDNFERMCDAYSDKESSEHKGMIMITRQFFDALCSLGLEVIPDSGKFDPSVHEAAGIEQVEEEEMDGSITTVLRKGYKLAGRVIRAAQVRVGKFC